MAEKNKRYFWLKLKDDFFSQKEIKMLRRIAGGDTYTIIYLKMLLLSLKNDGKIYFDGIAENFVEEIALDIDEDTENTQITFNYLAQKGLIEFSDAELEMTNIASMIGSETDAARRKRKQRTRKKALLCDNVTTKSQLGHTEIEIEKELDIELEEEETPAAARDEMESYFGSLTQYMFEDLEFYKDKFDELDAIVIEAIEISRQRSVKNWNYTKKIIQDWRNHNLKTLDAVRKHEAKSKLNNYKPTNQEVDLNTDYEKSLTEKLGF